MRLPRVTSVVLGTSVAMATAVATVPVANATGSRARGRATVTGTTWTLVATTCQSGWVETGRACFDPAGHAGDWASVHESSATSNPHGEVNSYTYTLPETISDGGANQLLLHSNVSQISDGGAHSRICAQLPFAKVQSGDACATTAETPNGGSADASGAFTLKPMQGNAGATVEIVVGFEEPGGYLHYTYRATEQRTKVTFRFSARLTHPRAKLPNVVSVTFDGHGSFVVEGPPRGGMVGSLVTGSARISLHFPKDPKVAHDARLELTRAQFTSPDTVYLYFRVASSSTACLPAHRQLSVVTATHRATPPSRTGFKLCDTTPGRFVNSSTTVTITTADITG